LSLEEYGQAGARFFEQTYGSSATTVQGLLDECYPDMGFFSQTIGYGFTYSFLKHLSTIETSFVLITSLIAVDTPRQIKWHLDGAIRNGADAAQVSAVREMAIAVADEAGLQRRNEVPEMN
jgi:alkylhydroperoxidase/carboxymuconolactone decarboxylase family protein YurZ